MEKSKLSHPLKAIIIGGSAGSLEVLFQVLPLLKSTLSVPVIIVLHRRSSGRSSLHELLAYKTALPLCEVEDKEPIRPGHIYLAPANYHLLIEDVNSFSLDGSEKVHYSRPSLDVTFESAADVYGANVVGLVLSGANEDGTRGLQAIKGKGGCIAIQLPSTAKVPVMPQSALDHVGADYVLATNEIADFINHLGPQPDRRVKGN